MRGRPRGAERVIAALDVADLPAALAAVDRIGPGLCWVKVGLELFVAEGPAALRALAGRGLKVFLDLKLHDIPRTVARAAAAAARHGAAMLTVHCDAGVRAMRAAREEARAAAARAGVEPPLVLGVTVLTSWDEASYRRETGWPHGLREAVRQRALLAVEAGLDGVVCAPAEAACLRASGDRSLAELVIVCPGIRPAGLVRGDDQAAGRVFGAGEAVRAGADWIVVGRPLLEAASPAMAFAELLAEIGQAERALGR